MDNTIASIAFKNQHEAIEYLNKASTLINLFNKELESFVVAERPVYGIELVPDGKLYSFISNEDLEINQLAICDTVNGRVFGVIKTKIMSTNFSKHKLCEPYKV